MLIATLACAGLVSCGGSGGSTTPTVSGECTAGPTKRVLFVGNSQIAVQNLPMIVASLSQSAPAACPRIESTAIVVGGGNLRDAWQGGQVQAALATRSYDVVVLAESIDLVFPQDTGYPADFNTYARLLIAAARNAGTRPILYATPNVDISDREAAFQGMATPQLALGRELGVTVATGGLAWLRVWREVPTVRLHDTDLSHPSYLGSTLSSLVIYAAINDATPIGLAAMPDTDYCRPNCPLIAPSLAAVFQRHAWDEYLANGRR